MWSSLPAAGTLQHFRIDDCLIALAYFSIPAQIVYSVSYYPRLTKMPFRVMVLVILFALFIFFCGAGHALRACHYDHHDMNTMLQQHQMQMKSSSQSSQHSASSISSSLQQSDVLFTTILLQSTNSTTTGGGWNSTTDSSRPLDSSSSTASSSTTTDSSSTPVSFSWINWMTCLVSIATSIYMGIMIPQMTAWLDEAVEHMQYLHEETAASKRKMMTFMSFLCHEIRNPLFLITSHLTFLSDDALTENQQRTVAAIDQSTQLMLRLVNDVLDISRLEKGNIALEECEFNLRELLQLVANHANQELHKRKLHQQHLRPHLQNTPAQTPSVEFGFELGEAVPALVRGDAARFLQITYNLLSNATKFTTSGNVQFDVQTVDLITALRKGWVHAPLHLVREEKAQQKAAAARRKQQEEAAAAAAVAAEAQQAVRITALGKASSARSKVAGGSRIQKPFSGNAAVASAAQRDPLLQQDTVGNDHSTESQDDYDDDDDDEDHTDYDSSDQHELQSGLFMGLSRATFQAAQAQQRKHQTQRRKQFQTNNSNKSSNNHTTNNKKKLSHISDFAMEGGGLPSFPHHNHNHNQQKKKQQWKSKSESCVDAKAPNHHPQQQRRLMIWGKQKSNSDTSNHSAAHSAAQTDDIESGRRPTETSTDPTNNNESTTETGEILLEGGVGDGTVSSSASTTTTPLSSSHGYQNDSGDWHLLDPNTTAVLVLSVKDTGPGIPKDRMQRIFKPYTRCKLSDYRKHGGTGLGLAIVSQLVHVLGGSLQADSKVGKGSLFKVYLPVQLAAPVMAAAAAAGDEAQQSVAGAATGATEISQLVAAAAEGGGGGLFSTTPEIKQSMLFSSFSVAATGGAQGAGVGTTTNTNQQQPLFSSTSGPTPLFSSSNLGGGGGGSSHHNHHRRNSNNNEDSIRAAAMMKMNSEKVATSTTTPLASVIVQSAVAGGGGGGAVPLLFGTSGCFADAHELLKYNLNSARIPPLFQDMDLLESDGGMGLSSHHGRQQPQQDSAVPVEQEVQALKIPPLVTTNCQKTTFDSVVSLAQTISASNHLKEDPPLFSQLFQPQNPQELACNIPRQNGLFATAEATTTTPLTTTTTIPRSVFPSQPPPQPKFKFAPNTNVVLVTDDNTVNRKLFSRMLAHFQLEYRQAENGKVAVDRILASRNVNGARADPDAPHYGLVLMDLCMPVMDGCEAIKTMRDSNVDIPIIALTANATEGSQEDAMDAGATEFATKPILRNVLYEICKRHLRESAITNPNTDTPMFCGGGVSAAN